MKRKSEIELMLLALCSEQIRIEKEIPPGQCHWRINKAKIEMLQWVLNK
jgi:hypothetical protein